MEIGGSSKAFDVSALREDLEYMRASNVNVSNFVSVKLSGTSNYKIWKEQMLCLLKSQALLYIVDAGCPSPGDKGVNPQYDQLVKGWIFGSVNEKVLRDLIDSGTAQEVWMKLESLFSPTVSYTKGDSSNAHDVSTLDVVAPVVSAMREDLKYLQALNVDVSNFISEKLEDERNYYTWKNEMLSLIRSHELLHIIHAEEARFPWNEGDPMTTKYDSLVRGWILNAMNDDRRDQYRIYRSVQEMWRRLESTFTYQPDTSDSDIEDTNGILECNADDSSNETENLKYMQLKSNVNVYDFVSVKLSGCSNYNLWKDQMLRLLQSHNLLHIIHEEAPFQQDKDDTMTKKYDSLVRSWLLSTMNDEERHKYRIYRSVKLMWSNIESTFDEIDGLKYMEASNVNVFDFVSVNLSDANNYSIWKAQMLYFLECHSLLHIINELYCPEENKYGELVKGWLLCTMNDELIKEFPAEDSVNVAVQNIYAYYVKFSANYLWGKLESRFTKGCSRPEPVVSASTQDLKYTQALNVNVSNFVSVKLSGRSNYTIWKIQMLCLIESQKLLHFIDKEYNYEVDNKYNTLVRGWIFSTMNEQLLNDFQYIFAKVIWAKLKSTFDPAERESDSKDETSPGFEFRTEFVRVPEIEDTDSSKIKKELYEAAVEGCWWKAKSLLENNNIAATEAITTTNGNTILHLAVEMGHNYFVEKVLEFIKDGKDIETQNSMGQTALHIAAMVGNIHAAQVLIQKRKQLLEIKDHVEQLPFYIATNNMKVNISAYLIESTPSSVSVAYPLRHKVNALYDAIIAKQYDLAETLIREFADVALTEIMLMAITITFPTDLGFTESFIYPSFHNVDQKKVMRDSLLFHPDKCVDDILRTVKICNNMCCNWLGKNSMILLVPIATLYPIYWLIRLFIMMLHLTFPLLYFLLWKVLGVIARPIKNIEKKKKEYQNAKKILSLICNQEGISNEFLKIPLFEAVRQDIYEVVDEILFTSPAAIDCKDKEGYNVIQLAIVNRSEKVYNLINHIMERTDSYRKLEDSSGNKLVHLVGKLAPSFVLGRTTGAALQLQKELLWREEVKKHLLPLELRKKNIHNETPEMVFTKEHEDLMKQGENWIKTTAESCSITAALIVTIVFAAAITVPGGSNQESGIPVFKKEIAFTIFALFNALSLFAATTALLLFLSILTTRFSEKDFLVSLPRRLIFGLFMLFLSTTTMIVAFCAILFIVFCDQRPWMLAPITGFAFLPISVILTIKLPLLMDLIKSTYFPIFGDKSYLESCKINRKSTFFTR